MRGDEELVEETVVVGLCLLCLEEVVVGVDDMCSLQHVFSVHSNILNHPPHSLSLKKRPHFNWAWVYG